MNPVIDEMAATTGEDEREDELDEALLEDAMRNLRDLRTYPLLDPGYRLTALILAGISGFLVGVALSVVVWRLM